MLLLAGIQLLLVVLLAHGITSDPGFFWEYFHTDGWGNPNRMLEENSGNSLKREENEDLGSKLSEGSNYSYGYGVDDAHTGDVKTAYETKEGELTKGSYSVLQPDGVLRTVTYESDPWNGFRATVYNKGWRLRQNSHGWGGFQYDFKDNRVYSEVWMDANNKH